MGIRCQKQGVFSNLIEGLVSKHQAVQKGSKSRVYVLERSCGSASTTVSACVYVCVDVRVYVCGVSVSVDVSVHVCVARTGKSRMDWSSLRPQV